MLSFSRKWNSKQLNVGVLSETFWLPEFPKVMISWHKVMISNDKLAQDYYIEIYREKFSLLSGI